MSDEQQFAKGDVIQFTKKDGGICTGTIYAMRQGSANLTLYIWVVNTNPLAAPGTYGVSVKAHKCTKVESK